MAKGMVANLNAIVANTLTESIQMIDIDELHSSPDNFFFIERIDEFAETILGQGGVKDNLVVRPIETGGYEVISGHRRRAAVKLLIDRGENVSRYLPCLVQEYSDDDDKMLDIILMNVTARRLSDQELWKSYEIVDAILKKKKGAGEKFGRIREALAGFLGVSPAQVGKMQNVEKNAIDEVKAAIESGEISISTANEIAKLDEEEQAKLVQTDLSSIKHKDVKKLTEAEKKKPVEWDGEICKDQIKELLLRMARDDEKEAALYMKNYESSEMLRKNHRTQGFGGAGQPFVKCSDKGIDIEFKEPFDDKGNDRIFLTWSMAARYLFHFVAEEKNKETETQIDSKAKGESDEEKVDTYSNISEDDQTEEQNEQHKEAITMIWDKQAYKESIMQGLGLLITDDVRSSILNYMNLMPNGLNECTEYLKKYYMGFVKGYTAEGQSIVIRCCTERIEFDFQRVLNNVGATVITLSWNEAARKLFILVGKNEDETTKGSSPVEPEKVDTYSNFSEDEQTEEPYDDITAETDTDDDLTEVIAAEENSDDTAKSSTSTESEKVDTYINSPVETSENDIPIPVETELAQFVTENYYDIEEVLETSSELPELEEYADIIAKLLDIFERTYEEGRKKARFGV